MIQKFIQANNQLFDQISDLLQQLSDEAYTKPLSLLSGNSLAKHVRHILELNQELEKGLLKGVVNYDARERNQLIETSKQYALEAIRKMKVNLNQMHEDFTIELMATFDASGTQVPVQTTLGRELVYNIEHAIHHMAIIQIAVLASFPDVSLPKHFGVAFSTIIFQSADVHIDIHSN